jgi:spermidine synthase
LAKTKKKRLAPKQTQPVQQTESSVTQRLRYLVLAAFCLSGFAGLMHQVVWAKLLASLIGTAAHAQAAVLAVFMGGLALGSVLFGRRVDRLGSPLRTYVVLEVLIAVYCLLLPLLLQATQSGYIILAGYFFESPSFTFALRFSLAFLLILFPAVLMGGTLPVLCRQLVTSVEQTQKYVASLYSLNSFGAVLGAATAGFVTLPLFGIYISLVIAALLNLGAAGLLLNPAKRETPQSNRDDKASAQVPEKHKQPDPGFYSKAQYRATLVALGLSGFAALGYEVLFTRIIAISFGSSAYSFTVMLMAFITGISLGSAIISRIRVSRPLWVFAISQLLVVVALLAITPFVSRLPYLIGLLRIELQDAHFGFELYQLGKVALCLVVLLVPTTFLGFCFPLVAQVQARRSPDIGYRVGSTYAWNTVGNVFGAVITSLVLMPTLGLLNAFHFNLGLNLSAGLIVLLVASEITRSRRLVAAAVITGLLVFYPALGLNWLDPINLAPNHLRLNSGPDASDSAAKRALHPASSFDAWKQHYVVDPSKAKKFYFEEDAQTTVLGIKNDRFTYLYVNGKPDAGTSGDLPTQLLLAHLPMFLVPNAQDVLVIGHGSGITSGSLTRHPVQQVDIVEISPGVLNADSIFSEHNYRVLEDPRVRTHLDDAQSYLRASPDLYDLIISEPSNPWVAGISGLFTREFFEEMSGKLNPDGRAVVWFHAYEQSDEGVNLVLRTIDSVFPYVIVGRSHNYLDFIVIASNDPIKPDFEAMEDRFDQPAVRNDLGRLGIPNLASLLFLYTITPEGLDKVLPAGPLNTIAHQRLEYSAPVSHFYDESSSFLKRNDPLLHGAPADAKILGDYIKYRATAGEPVRRHELEDIIRRAYKKHATSILSGLPLIEDSSAQRPNRSARGLIPEATKTGFYEAGYWEHRFRKAGKPDLALPYSQRLQALEDATNHE